MPNVVFAFIVLAVASIAAAISAYQAIASGRDPVGEAMIGAATLLALIYLAVIGKRE